VPLASWLRGPLRGWAEERLAAGLLGAAGIDERVALALFGEHLRRERDHGRALWTLVVLAEWLDWAAGLRENGPADWPLVVPADGLAGVPANEPERLKSAVEETGAAIGAAAAVAGH
jgi:hypothetical protein